MRFTRKEDYENAEEVRAFRYEYDMNEETAVATLYYPDWHPTFKLESRFFDKVLKPVARDIIEDRWDVKVDMDELRLVTDKIEPLGETEEK